MAQASNGGTDYDKVIEYVFMGKYADGAVSVDFTREELSKACDALGIPLIKNLGDITYSYRFRRELPESIKSKAPQGCEWVILGTGRAAYQFRLAKASKVAPSPNRRKVKIPDATPEVVKMYAPANDEQALLTKVRYNRVIDLFTGVTCYSIQNHLRTTVNGIGQIEIDEIYLGVDRFGVHYIIPCQAKSIGDSFGITQVLQDIAFASEKYQGLQCRPIAMQFLDANSFAILEFSIDVADDMLELVVVNEAHYTLASKAEFEPSLLLEYLKLKE